MNYVRVGCFKDKPDRRAMTLLASYRNPEDNTMDWNDLKTSVVDKCARKAKENGSTFFGIQYFGECWGLPGQYNQYGVSLNCQSIGGAFVGRNYANYVYMLTEGECTNYEILNNFTRSRNYTRFLNRCDSFNYGWKSGWYRFDGASGKLMANSCVSYGHCGTHQTGWFNGRLPRVAEGKIPAWVCFNDRSSCCNDKTKLQISVRRCDGFYVYNLPRSTNGCFKAYCGNGP